MSDPHSDLDDRRADRLRVLSDMAGGMAHEFNQPISIIRTSAENMLIGYRRQWELPIERTMGKLEVIMAQCDRMSAMIDHLRALTQQDGDRSVRPTPVATVIANALSFVRAQCNARGIRIIMDDEAPQSLALIHPFALEECLLAVLYNARDALIADAKPGCIRIRTHRDHDGITISVSDDGPGMTPEQLEQVGQPFFTTKRPGKGVGLSLAMARQTLAAMSCSLSVTSVVGQGTTVSLRCPEAGA